MALYAGALGLIAGLISPVAAGPVYTTLHEFFGSDGYGAEEPDLLAQGRDGNLYGTAPFGGFYGNGAAFKLTPTGTFTKLHDFKPDTEGGWIWSGLTVGKDGNFYGAASQSEFADFPLVGSIPGGGGSIFKMTPAGVLTVLHRFGEHGPADGRRPWGPPVQGRDGNFYGTTALGGASAGSDDEFGVGTVYKITPTGTFTTLYSFDRHSSLGYLPQAPLILGRDGNFYGTTVQGGPWNFGTVFRITPGGVVTTLYNFDGTHGATPTAPVVQGADGNFYGTTLYGGISNSGTVFKLTPQGVITVLYSADITTPEGQAKGWYPHGGVVQGSDGNIYGTMNSSIQPGCCGGSVLFKITAAGVYTVEHIFSDHTVSTPMVHTNGKVYGLTSGDNIHNRGTLYSFDIGAPALVSVSPGAAKVGTSIGLFGSLAGTTGVLFNGISATFSGSSSTYRTAVVPAGAATGPITVIKTVGSVSTLAPFLQLPTITTFSPTSGALGSVLVLTGTGLTQATAVKIGGKTASFTVNTDSQLTVTVPPSAVTGKVAVTTKGGSATSAAVFTVIP